MNLLERYLQAVGQYLPPETREDVLAELRVNLQAEMDARAEEREGPLTETDAAAILKAHGRPMVVAARYMPQRYLIGPEVFPFYLLTLRKTAPLVVLLYLVAHLASFIFSPNPGAFAANMARTFVQLVPVLLISWAAITLTFAILEYVQKQHGHSAWGNDWDPAKLPSLERPAKEKSLASRIADLILHCLWMLYVFAIPRHPFLVLGPGALFMTMMSAGWAPVWRLFYIAIIVLLLAQLAIKLMALARGKHRWEAPLELLTKFLGVVPTALLALTKVYFIPTSPAANLHVLAQINYWLNASFKIVLLIVVLSLAWDSWQYFRRFVPTERLAF
jgi:hypothetical protein